MAKDHNWKKSPCSSYWICNEYEGTEQSGNKKDDEKKEELIRSQCSVVGETPEKKDCNGKRNFPTISECSGHRIQDIKRKSRVREQIFSPGTLCTKDGINGLREMISIEIKDRLRNKHYVDQSLQELSSNSILIRLLNKGAEIKQDYPSAMIDTIRNLYNVCDSILSVKGTNDYALLSGVYLTALNDTINIGEEIKGRDIYKIQTTISAAITDCICYSDCHGFGSCTCYGYCNCNY